MRRILPIFLAVLLFFTSSAMAAAPVSRGEFVQSLWELWGSVPYEDTFFFTDLPHDTTYTSAICWAHDLGLVMGVGGRRFEPTRPITREEAAVFLRRAAAHIGRDTATISNVAQCNDYVDISPWADDSLYWATEQELIHWAEGGLRAPYGTLTTEETADIFTRFHNP